MYYTFGWITMYADANVSLLALLLLLNEGESAGLAWAECARSSRSDDDVILAAVSSALPQVQPARS